MKQYHHPDLRSALMDAALEELAERGARLFSLRRVSARAGVSHTAPYRHFADKDALLAALVLEGMKSLTRALRDAAALPARTARERLGTLGRTYVAFGREHPQVLSLMFSGIGFQAIGRARTGRPKSPEYDAFGVLEAAVTACQREGSLDPGKNPGILSLLVWSTVHGLSVLFIENVIPHMVAERGASGAGAEAELLTALGDLFAMGKQG